jgi:O-antigen/teichoic acid export membrane protein
VTVYLARTLEPALFGAISIGLAVLGYLTQLSGSGIQVLEARNSAARKGVDADRVSAVLSLRLLAGVVLLLLSVAGSFIFIAEAPTRDSIWLHALMLIPLGLSLEWFFQGKELFGMVGSSKVVNSVVYACFALLMVRGPDDFRFAAISLFMGAVAAALLLIALYQRGYGKIRFAMATNLWREMIKGSVPVGIAMLAGQNAVNLGPIVLGALFTTTDVGMYSAGMKLIIFLLLLDRTLNAVYLPYVSRIKAHRPEDLARIVSISLKVVIVLIVPLAVCCFAAADELIPLVFGPGYEVATTMFRVLLGYFVVTIPNSILVCTLIASGKEAEYTRALVIGSSILACCVVGLAMNLGPIGAAAGVVVGELSIFLMLLARTRKIVEIPFVPMMTRPFVAFMVMAGTAILCAYWNVIAAVLLSILVFFGTLLLVGGVEREEVEFVKDRLI